LQAPRKKLRIGRYARIICQGSVIKLRQIAERLLWRFDAEGFAVKAAVFDRVKAAIDLLKQPPNGFAVFAEAQRGELLKDADCDESDIQKRISRDWRALSKEARQDWSERAHESEILHHIDKKERNRRNRVRDQIHRLQMEDDEETRKTTKELEEKERDRSKELFRRRYQLSATQSEANRKLYCFLLTLVAPPPPKFERDKTSLVRSFAKAIGVDRKSSAWSAAIERRAAIDDFMNTPRTWEVYRKRRSDALTDAQRGAVERFWEENTTPSPSERDLKRHRVGRNQYVLHQAHEQHPKTRGLLEQYNKDNADDTVSYGTFQMLKPFYVRKAGAQSCLCRYCENLRQLFKALVLNRKIFLDLDAERREAGPYIHRWLRRQHGRTDEAPSKWRRRRGVITVASLLLCEKKSDLLRLLCCGMDAELPVGKKYGLDAGADDDERARRLAEARERRRSFVASREGCMGCGTEECKRCGDVNDRLNRDREFEKQLWGPEAEPKTKMKWSSYRTEIDDEGNNKADNEVHRHEGHPSRFLDELVVALEHYKMHYYTLKRQKRAHLEQERNFQCN